MDEEGGYEEKGFMTVGKTSDFATEFFDLEFLGFLAEK